MDFGSAIPDKFALVETMGPENFFDQRFKNGNAGQRMPIWPFLPKIELGRVFFPFSKNVTGPGHSLSVSS